MGFAGAIVVTVWAAAIIRTAIMYAQHPSPNPAIDSNIHLHDSVVYGILDWAGYRALRLER
jgi:hypothetical protein